MTNQDLSRALVAALQSRQEARGNCRADANAFTVGYLESMIAGLCNLSPKVKKDVLSTLVYVTANQAEPV